MISWIPYLIAANAIITAVVLWLVFRRASFGAAIQPGLDIPQLWQFADEIHERVGEYVRTNYSGSPEMLPQVLGRLLDELEGEASSRNLPLSREMLKVLLVRSLGSHRLAEPRELRSALSKVA